MKAAVIGCNGYLGKHLSTFLVEKGWRIIGYDLSQFSMNNLIEYRYIDITHKDNFEIIDKDFDFIFYFSGITGTISAYENYENFIDINEKGLLHLLNFLRKSNSESRIIFPSTRLVYKGVPNEKLNESSEKEFKTIYSLNKWFGEQIIQQYSCYFNIKYNIFRICVPYGNLFTNEYSYGTVGFFIRKALANQDIILFGDGNQKRTFTYVEDICTQIYDTILHPESLNRIFNIAGETFSLKEVAEKIAKKYNISIKYKEWALIDKNIESGDTIFDSSKIQSLINKLVLSNFDEWLNKN